MALTHTVFTSVKTKYTVSFAVLLLTCIHNVDPAMPALQNRASHYCESLNNHKGVCEKKDHMTNMLGNSLIF